MSDARLDQAKGEVKEAAGRVTGDAGTEAEGRVESTVAGIRREAGEVADKATDVAGDVVDEAGDAASDTVDKAGDAASDTVDMAGDVASDTLDKAKDMLDR